VSAAAEPATGAGQPTLDVMGVGCFVGTPEDAADRVVQRALSKHGGYAVLCNVHVLMTAQERPDVRRALDGAWLVLPDGAPVAWLQRRLGEGGAARVGGPDLMPLVLDRGREVGLRHVLLGSTQPTLDLLEKRIRMRLPGVEIAGSVAPPFTDSAVWTAGVVEKVATCEPHIVWLALGAPRQELWMREHAGALSPALVLGVGAAFDFHAGTTRRAPAWMRRSGLEWLHRLGSEPRRLAGRYVTTNAAFVVRSARTLARQKTAS
jgi:N-acetylglucosaminyldiphosphoundecaprenol N-acetyl-beta-D-mannosaminyltransferase